MELSQTEESIVIGKQKTKGFHTSLEKVYLLCITKHVAYDILKDKIVL